MMKVAAVALAVAGLLGGCSSGSSAAPKVAASAAEQSPSSSPTAATPTSTATPTAEDLLDVGQPYENQYVRVTVERIALDQKGGSSGVYSGALVKSCVKKVEATLEYIGFSWTPWSMIDADSGRYPDLGESGGDLPSPVYPNGDHDGTFKAGDCVKGWIFFDVPKGTDIAKVRYQPESFPDPVEWAVG